MEAPSRTAATGMSRGGRTDGCRAAGRIPAASERSPKLAIAPDQSVGGAVVAELGFLGALELGDDPLRERLPQLHAPLIEGVDLPDGALGEDAVLVERDQFAERSRRQLLEQ